MLQYVLKRLLLMIPTILGAAFVIFFILRVVPGDVCELKLGGDGGHYDPVQVEICQKNLGIDRPLYEQFGKFVYGIFTFDYGNSMDTGKPVTHEIGLRFQLSLQIAIMATLVTIIIAIPLGTISAVYQNSWVDYVVRTISIAGIALPSFWLGILLLLFLLNFSDWCPIVLTCKSILFSWG